MADNKINVTVSANTRKNITVSSAQQSTEITASTDTGRFWAQTAKNWAVSDVIVDNTDFSSKHYAQEAKESAISAGGFETSTREMYDSFFETANNAVSNVQSSRDEAIEIINNTVDGALSNVDSAVQGAITTIDTNSNEAVETINNTVDSAVESIGIEANKQIDNIERTGFYMRDDKLYFINSVGEEEEFKANDSELIEEKLVDKVDTNASNFTAEGKSLIATFPTPDYENGIIIWNAVTASTYTVDKVGWYYIYCAKANTSGSTQCKINGFVVTAGQYGASQGTVFSTCLPCSIGDVITFDNVGQAYLTYYPFKGGA